MVGASVFDHNSFDLGHEVVIAGYIYFIAMICRFLSIGTFMRYLRKLGEGLNWNEVIFLTFAGLKGAIGISLGMLVFHN
jgi:NhaP-type Na+/H+ or K+/H+ antiporter